MAALRQENVRRLDVSVDDPFRVSWVLDGKLANGILDAYRKDDIIRKFITNTSAPAPGISEEVVLELALQEQ